MAPPPHSTPPPPLESPSRSGGHSRAARAARLQGDGRLHNPPSCGLTSLPFGGGLASSKRRAQAAAASPRTLAGAAVARRATSRTATPSSRATASRMRAVTPEHAGYDDESSKLMQSDHVLSDNGVGAGGGGGLGGCLLSDSAILSDDYSAGDDSPAEPTSSIVEGCCFESSIEDTAAPRRPPRQLQVPPSPLHGTPPPIRRGGVDGGVGGGVGGGGARALPAHAGGGRMGARERRYAAADLSPHPTPPSLPLPLTLPCLPLPLTRLTPTPPPIHPYTPTPTPLHPTPTPPPF